MTRTALITGITGQDGSYLAELLLAKDYRVVGLRRRVSTPNLGRITHLLSNPNLILEYGDMTEVGSLQRVLKAHQPDEVYNLAAQSFVTVSFLQPAYTRNTIYHGTINLLVTCMALKKPPKIYLAGSSEMFGNSPAPQSETTPFMPVSPYGHAKADAFRIGKKYREQHGLWIANGILFNHESPRRGTEFVTRKITTALGRMACGLQDKCTLGNLDAKRDWGFAGDYVEAMWLMLQQEDPDDFVIATGETRTVAEFLKVACEMSWHFHQIGAEFDKFFVHDPSLVRAAEVNCLQGDSTKARQKLGWKPRTTFGDLVSRMVRSDYRLARQELLLRQEAEEAA